MLLEVRDLFVSYEQIEVIHGISLQVSQSGIISIIGANGAGKSTILKAVSGLIRPTSGEVDLDGQRIDDCDVTDIVSKGIAHCPERRRLFPYMSVRDNLFLGAYLRKNKEEIGETFEQVCQLFPVLGKRLRQKAGSLSGGEQQMAAIARALMSRPRLLLLDEPTLGLAPFMVTQVAETVKDIRNEGISVMLVEQNVRMALKVTDHAYLLDQGRIVLEGTPDIFYGNDSVRQTFLGE